MRPTAVAYAFSVVAFPQLKENLGVALNRFTSRVGPGVQMSSAWYSMDSGPGCSMASSDGV